MSARSRSLAALLPLALAVAAACASAPSGTGEAGPSTPAPAPAPLSALLPASAGPFHPAEVQIEQGSIDGRTLADVDECDGCHAGVVAQWRTSAHALASFNNPVYRAVVDRFRDEAGREPSRFCGGCHDLALLVDGAMDRDVSPADPRAHAGITCRACHSVTATRPDGNGSFILTAAPIPIPTPGDAQSVAEHRARVKPREGEGLCIACHRAFLGEPTGNAHFLIGQDDVTPWQRSAYAGSLVHLLDDPVPEQGCRGCHMPEEPMDQNEVAAAGGRASSHRFLGAHTWLAAMRGDGDVARRTAALLRDAVSLDIAAVVHEDGARSLPADGAPVAAGARLVIDVVLRNQRVGHRFPGGVMDAQDTWIEIDVRDARGDLLAGAGDDPGAHRLRALAVGEDGRPLLERETHRFRAVTFNHTLLPREAQVVEYAFRVPDALPALPLRITARLRHRTRNLELARLSCAASRDARGRAFRAFHPASDLDACEPPPVTTLAEAEVWIGAGWSERASAPSRPTWRRLYEHGLGLLNALQERRGEAGPSLERALADLGEAGDPRARAMVMAAQAALAARLGRADDALAWVERATLLAPDHPALHALRGEALGAVWRFRGALGPLARAAEAAPHDDAAWTALAIARGSAGDDRGALDAALRGLALQPRDQDLLRVQALSLRGLSAPTDLAAAAQRAYLAHRPADSIPGTKAKCSRDVPGCANERSPVHVHELKAVR